jgi:hypothetical protein
MRVIVSFECEITASESKPITSRAFLDYWFRDLTGTAHEVLNRNDEVMGELLIESDPDSWEVTIVPESEP